MGATSAYNRGKFCVGTGLIQLDKDDLRVLLVSAGYVFNAAHRFTNITNELGGSGYIRKQLVNKTVTQNDVLSVVQFDCDRIVWAGANFGTPDAAIIYKEGATDALREVLCSLDLNPKVATAGGALAVIVNALGVLLLQ